jgi:acyl-CoA synthetase (AMP-forming)/AMP-acid ligase II
MSVLSRFAEAARTWPQAVALASTGRTLSYAALDEQAHAIAAALREAGVRRGEVVAIALGRSIDHVAALLGVWRAAT